MWERSSKVYSIFLILDNGKEIEWCRDDLLLKANLEVCLAQVSLTESPFFPSLIFWMSA